MELEIFFQKWLSLYYDLEIDTKWFMKAYKVIFNVDFESAIHLAKNRKDFFLQMQFHLLHFKIKRTWL